MLLDNKNIVNSVTKFSHGIKYTQGDIFIYPNPDDLDPQEDPVDPRIYRVNALDAHNPNVHSYDNKLYTSTPPDQDINSEYPLYTLYAEPVTESIAGIPYFTGAKVFSNSMEFMQLLGSNSCSLVMVPGSIANSLCSSSTSFNDNEQYVLLSRSHGQQVIAISLEGNLTMINKVTNDYTLDETAGTSITLADFSGEDPANAPYMMTNRDIISNRTNSGLIEYNVSHEDSDPDNPHQISDDDHDCIVRVTGDLANVELIKVVVQYDFNGGIPSYQETIPIYIKGDNGRICTNSINTDGMFCRLKYDYVSYDPVTDIGVFTVTATKTEDTGGAIANMRSIMIRSIIGLKRIQDE